MSKTQNQHILAVLKAGLSLTSLQALKRHGCFRLAARIHDLKQQGHDIQKEMIKVGSKRVARYWL